MKCPVDEAVLVMSERSGVEIDYCPQCRGVWLDRGELDKILDRAAQEFPPHPAHDRPAYDQAAHDQSGPFGQGPVPPPPPAPAGGRRPRFMGSAPSAPSPEDHHYPGGYGRAPRRRRKSWLSEFFD